MGMLDEAIREHLDLKRRRGADPAEIERAEREALGPVRRESMPTFAVEHEPGVDELPAPAEAIEPAPVERERPSRRRGLLSRRSRHEPAADHELIEPVSGYDPTAAYEPMPEPQPGPDPGLDPHEAIEAGLGEPGLEPAAGGDVSGHPPVAAPVPPVPAAEEPHAETAEYDVESTFENAAPDTGGPETSGTPESPAATDDVLEETPEFLQDTPDHDRLWFEQKPPRDFDFDG